MSEACAWVSIKNNIQGQMCACANACSSSGDAVGFAFRAVRDGYADYAIAGGTEAAIVPIGVISFNNMRALSSWAGDPSKASRPFDKNRSGFVIAEGAAVMIFERKDLALARGAKIYGEIIGYGATSDAYHITAMHPEGLGAEQAIRLALTDANITPEDVGYINAHGTGTLMNDVIETSVIKRIFGSHADPANPGHVCVSSTKSMTGHMLGAAGASEGAFTVLALYNKILPPTINLDEPDPVCDLDYIANKSRLAPQIKFAISNTFGFGGGNSVLVFKRHEG
jgi:3-oxoacyl-[acyl-carrier-protein] synthase II